MSGDVSWKRYVDRRFADADQRFDDYVAQHESFTALALQGLRDADQKAHDATEKRFDKVDDLRVQLEGRVAALIPRAETEARITAASQRSEAAVQSVADKLDEVGAKIDQGAFVTREFFDSYTAKQDDEHRRIYDQLGVIFQDQSNQRGRQAAFAITISVGLIVVQVVVAILLKVL